MKEISLRIRQNGNKKQVDQTSNGRNNRKEVTPVEEEDRKDTRSEFGTIGPQPFIIRKKKKILDKKKETRRPRERG